MKMRAFFLSVSVMLVLTGCGGSDGQIQINGNQMQTGTGDSDKPKAEWYQPKVEDSWYIQLQGNLNLDYDVDIYDVDLFDTPAETITDIQKSGKKVICYFSAGSYENYRADKHQFLDADLGKVLENWEQERWLDIRSDNVRKVMQTRLDIAKKKGCDAVDPDNMDGYSNDNGLNLTAQDQLDYNQFIAEQAHNRGLAVGLKNDLEQVSELVGYYDFAVNESCYQYNECHLLLPFIDQGKPVFHIEYSQRNKSSMCVESMNYRFNTLIMPLALDGSKSETC